MLRHYTSIFTHCYRQTSMGSRYKINRYVLLLLCVASLSLTGCGTNSGTSKTAISTTTDPPIEGTIGSGSGKAILSWTAPKTNSDNTTLTDLAGFKVYYGVETPIDKDNSKNIDVGNITDYTLEGFDLGTYYFAVTAYDTSGNESTFSQGVKKIIS